MNPELHREITQRLLVDYDFKERGGFLRQGRCPKCNKKEFYTGAEAPWVVRCGRLNKCGHEVHIKDLYPDLFESWSDRHPQTPITPYAAADAYLRDARGFDISKIKGWYKQESFYSSKLDMGSATVRFTLPNGSVWERLIDKAHRFGKQKANFIGAYQGVAWLPPAFDLSQLGAGDELWLTEGVFDAIALIESGTHAASLMSCSNYPTELLAQLAAAAGRVEDRPTLVFALDNGKAGESFTRKFVAKALREGWKASAAQPPAGRKKYDWNELLQHGKLTAELKAEYRYLGKLLVAKSPVERALLMFNRKGWREFSFSHDCRLYWFSLDIKKFSAAVEQIHDSNPGLTDDEAKEQALLESGSVAEIASCSPHALYYQSNPDTDESWYYFRVDFPHDGAPCKNTFTGSQLSSASEFKKRLLAIAPGAVFTGQSGQLDQLMKRQLFDIKRVRTVDFVGYAKEVAAYIYSDIAIQNGRVFPLNDEDFFDLGKGESVKTLNHSVSLSINPDMKEFTTDWLRHLWTAFGAKGVVALAFWLGALFAEQIRASHKSYPFLEIVGEAGTGKSTLIEFLWKLFGRRDYEGFDPSKSTLAARARNFAQVSNLPVVLIEGDRDAEGAKQRGFDWDELKTAYNGRSVRARGVRNGGNETYEPPFRGAIVIAQNADVNASEAVLTRIIHLRTDRSGHNSMSKQAAEELERTPVEAVSGFLIKAASAEAQIMKVVDEATPLHEQTIADTKAVKMTRLRKNHAQIMALIDALSCVLPIPPEQQQAAKAYCIELAKERQLAVSADHPLVQEFWDAFEYLDGDDQPHLNHSRDPEMIAVNLNHFLQVAQDNRQQVPPLADLKRVLRSSRARKFVDIRTVNSAISERWNRQCSEAGRRPSTMKCWLFQRESN